MKSIKVKFVVYLSIIILFCAGFISFFSITSSRRAITAEIEDSLLNIATNQSQLIKTKLDTEKKILETIAKNPNIKSMDWESQLPELSIQSKNTNFIDLAISHLSGTTYSEDGNIMELGDRPYFQTALTGKSSVSDLLVTRQLNELNLLYASPIIVDEQIVGALTARADGNLLSYFIEDTGMGKSGYSYIINDKGTIIAHPDKDLVLNQFNPIIEFENDKDLKSINDFLETVLINHSGVYSYSFNNRKLSASYAPIEDTNWHFISVADEAEIFSAIPIMIRNIILSVIAVLLISISLTYMFAISIIKPISELDSYSGGLSEYNLSNSISSKVLSRRDEFGSLAHSVTSINDNLKLLVNEMDTSSKDLIETSDNLNIIINQTLMSSEEISRAIQEISSGAANQAINIEEGSNQAHSLGGLIEDNFNITKNLNDKSKAISISLDKAIETVDWISEITEESNNSSEEIQEMIIKTNDSAIEISQASNIISSIAEQTNLLALNAAIEAARAGDAGRGFSVVAEEIRNLAEQSSISVSSINKVVQDLQFNSETAVNTIGRMTEIFKSQSDNVTNTKNRYIELSNSILEMNEKIADLDISASEINEMKNEILHILDNLAAIAQENSAATEEVTASIEEQVASINEITSMGEKVADNSSKLKSMIMKFKI